MPLTYKLSQNISNEVKFSSLSLCPKTKAAITPLLLRFFAARHYHQRRGQYQHDSANLHQADALVKGERSGSGLCDVYNVWEENRFKRPKIIETINPNQITLTLQIEIDGNHYGNSGNHDDNYGNSDGNDGLPVANG
jgi:hypothetical protein